jgi:glucose-6-phosphate 1-epimerase
MTYEQTRIQELSNRFPIPGVKIDKGNGGLTRVGVSTPVASGELYLHGAHVTQFQPSGHAPILWMSEASVFASDKPIRGGVPICFPWFGPKASQPTDPSHGWARLKEWDLVGCGLMSDGGVSLELRTVIEDFMLSFRVEFCQTLRMLLSVELSPGITATRSFEEALHTYLCVGDIHQVTIEGLENASFVDKVCGATPHQPAREAIRFSGETDRVYHDTSSTCVLRDSMLNRWIEVRKAGSLSTVIWNPWIEKSHRMPDFGDEEWPKMVCIETANVGGNSIELRPGQISAVKVEIEAFHA